MESESMLSLKNLELLIVIRVRFREAVAVAAAGGPPFTFCCCIAMSAGGVFVREWFALFTGKAGDRERGELFNDFSLAIHLGCQAVIAATTSHAVKLDTVGTRA